MSDVSTLKHDGRTKYIDYTLLTPVFLIENNIALQAGTESTSFMRRCLRRYYYRPQRSCGKVMFSQACVKNSVHSGGGGEVYPSMHWGRHPWADTPRRPLQRTVRILLECFLVHFMQIETSKRMDGVGSFQQE